MQPIQIIPPPLYKWQIDVYQDKHRFRVVAASRRSGKNHLAAIEYLRSFLDGGNVFHITPNYPTGGPMFRLLTKLTEPIPGIQVNKADRVITAPNITDGYIQIRSANAALKGERVDFAGFDEVIDIVNFAEIWQGSISPSLATTRGKALFISSVFSYDHFWELVLLAQSDANPDWRAWIVDAFQAGVIPRDEIESQRRTMTASRFAREFMCQPLQLGSVFSLDSDNRSAHRANTQESGHTYVISVDVGGSIDPTAVAVIDLSVDPLECVYVEAFLEPNFSAQVVRIHDIWDRFDRPTLIVEANNVGAALVQQLRDAGIGTIRIITTTNSTKANQVEALKLAFENHRLRVIDDPQLALELAAFESSKTPSGLVHYAASKGHDDRVMALLLAYAGTAKEDKPTNQFIPNPLFPNGVYSRQSIFEEYTDAERRQHLAELIAKQRQS